MKANKFLTSILIISMISLYTSCEDFLYTPPYAKQIEDNFYTTEESLKLGFAGCYHFLSTKNYEYKKIEFGCIVSDDAEKGGTGDDDRADIDKIAYFQYLQSDNSYVQSIWDLSYTAIRNCNLFLQSAGSVPMANEKEKKRMIAEVQFIRANFYFELVRLFGPVPLLLDKITVSDRNQLRTPVEQIQQQMYKDLEASADLPLKSELASGEVGRITRGASQAMLARVALYFKDYQTAKTASGAVISSNEYLLDPDYGKIFRKEGNFGSESVWEIAHSTARNGSGDNNEGSGLPYRMRNINLGGLGLYRPCDNLVNEFEPGDPRLLYTIIVAGDAFEEEIQTPHAYGPSYYDRKSFIRKSQRKTDNDNGDLNIKVIRYSDVLLMYAEALLQTGGLDSEVTSLINQVRDRARKTPKTDPERSNQAVTIDEVDIPDVTVTGKDNLLKAIQHERRMEFAMEGHRYYDLLRWGIVESTLHAMGESQPNGKGKAFVSPKNLLMPIPLQTILSAAENFGQNTGY